MRNAAEHRSTRLGEIDRLQRGDQFDTRAGFKVQFEALLIAGQRIDRARQIRDEAQLRLVGAVRAFLILLGDIRARMMEEFLVELARRPERRQRHDGLDHLMRVAHPAFDEQSARAMADRHIDAGTHRLGRLSSWRRWRGLKSCISRTRAADCTSSPFCAARHFVT